MIADAKTADEEARLRTLHRMQIMDTAPEAPFDKIVQLVRQILRVPICAVSLVDRDRQWFKAQCGLDVSETSRDVSFCSHTIERAEPFVVADARQDPRFAENPLVTGAPFIRSYAGTPLTSPDGYNVGSLCVIDVESRQFSVSELAILNSFARLVMDEMALRQIASTDHLSGALSRRAWTERAEAEIGRARRYGRPLSLAIFDIDKFKLINDEFGHPAGDTVIRHLAELCMVACRQSDVFGRLGGEEFGLLMPETVSADALTVVERIRLIFGNNASDLGRPVFSTVSIGVAQLLPRESGLAALFERSDKALYDAKHGGRNQTVVDTAAEQPAQL
jgi:diguanylate cyclase (GGDEF)-like protein